MPNVLSKSSKQRGARARFDTNDITEHIYNYDDIVLHVIYNCLDLRRSKFDTRKQNRGAYPADPPKRKRTGLGIVFCEDAWADMVVATRNYCSSLIKSARCTLVKVVSCGRQ